MIRVIAEIGINHHGSLETAKELMSRAAASGCWGVKFQFRNIETFYLDTTEIGDEIVSAELRRSHLTPSNLALLAKYGRNLGLAVGVSVFRTEDLASLAEVTKLFDFFKVPSAEATNIPLIDVLLDHGRSVMISVGGHSTAEVKKHLGKYAKHNQVVIFHCVSNYPTKLGSQDLKVIETLRDIGFSSVGYSSHDEESGVCLIAMGMGYNWVERHITLDRKGAGLDDSSSSEADDFAMFNRFARQMPGILGISTRDPNQGEISNLQNLGTGLYAKGDFERGETPTLSDFTVAAPRKGLSVGEFVGGYSNKPLAHPISAGQPLIKQDFVDSPTFDSQEIYQFAKDFEIGVPVRVHDYEDIAQRIPCENYELHFSFGEILSGKADSVVDRIEPSCHFSIHLPDYLPQNRILDPISKDASIESLSKRIISMVGQIAERIEEKTGKEVPIVGSFSQTCGRSRNEVRNLLFDFIGLYERENVQRILPQWLPKYAWYFGGSVPIDVFCESEDLEFLESAGKEICLDVCHLVLSANAAGSAWRNWAERLIPMSKHWHLSDARGVDGEGLEIGSGEIGDFSWVLSEPGMKIIEVWQGHLNHGAGFVRAIDQLMQQEERGKKFRQ